MNDGHKGSNSISDFFGWGTPRWKRPIKLFRNIAAVLILLLLIGLGVTGLLRCDWWAGFC